MSWLIFTKEEDVGGPWEDVAHGEDRGICRQDVDCFGFFFQAEDGIRDDLVTGVQTCALPIFGWGGPHSVSAAFNPAHYHLKTMVLPVVSIAALPASYIARVTRASVLEVLNQDYIRTARAKGLGEYNVVVRHTIKNAMIPVLTVMGPIAAVLVSGSFIIETMFGIPGFGRESITAVVRRDYATIMGATLFYTLIVTLANLFVDLAYAVVDPRIRYR